MKVHEGIILAWNVNSGTLTFCTDPESFMNSPKCNVYVDQNGCCVDDLNKPVYSHQILKTCLLSEKKLSDFVNSNMKAICPDLKSG
jgi:hypothetical protein